MGTDKEMTAKEVAQAVGVSTSAIYTAAREGRIQVRKEGPKKSFFNLEEVRACFKGGGSEEIQEEETEETEEEDEEFDPADAAVRVQVARRFVSVANDFKRDKDAVMELKFLRMAITELQLETMT